MKQHHYSVDLLRLIAILGVIWFHIDGLPHRIIAFSGLIIFVLIATVLVGQSSKSISFKEFSYSRIRRLILPWGVWFSAYAALNFIIGKAPLSIPHDIISAVLAGPWIGLWYLPFILLISLAAFWAYRCTHTIDSKIIAYLALVMGFASMTLVAWIRSNGLEIRPWAQWLHALPAFFFGLAISRALKTKDYAILVSAICITPFGFGITSGFADPGISYTYALAVPITTIAFLIPTQLPKWTNTISVLVMGMYLVHGALISALKAIPLVAATPLLHFILTVFGAFFFSLIASRTPVIKTLI